MPRPWADDLTAAQACAAVRRYNSETYTTKRGQRVRNVELDDRLRVLLHRLGRTERELSEQLEAIALDYNAVRTKRMGLELSSRIARDLVAYRQVYESEVAAARDLAAMRADDFELLFRPFQQEYHSPVRTFRNWGVWVSKFLHFLNPAAFPILDTRVSAALLGHHPTSNARGYARFRDAFRTFTVTRAAWIPELRTAEHESRAGQALTSGSPHDNKIWDMVFFQPQSPLRKEPSRSAEANGAGA